MFLFEGLLWVSIMAICEFYKLECVCEWEGVIGVWLVLGASILHRMSSLSFARH